MDDGTVASDRQPLPAENILWEIVALADGVEVGVPHAEDRTECHFQKCSTTGYVPTPPLIGSQRLEASIQPIDLFG